MWIIPANYPQSSVSAPDMVASSEDLSLPGINIEQSLMWRSKPSLLRTWSQRWKRESWFRHLSGRILKPCQHTALESALTYSLAVIPASHSQQPVYEKAQTTPDTFGLTSGDTSRQLDLFAASSRTSRDTSASDFDKSSMIWKDLVTQRRGEYSARLKSARLTSESEFTFWPTPVAQDDNKSPEAHMRMKQRMKGGPRHKPTSLQVMVKGVERGLWPTPTAQDNNQVSGNPDHPKRGTTLGGAARLWPTPTASDSEGGRRQQDGKRGRALKDLPEQMWPTPSARDHKGGYKGGRIRNGKVSKDTLDVAVQHTDNQSQSAGQLNPTWVEWLMGLPLGWTDLGCWGTE